MLRLGIILYLCMSREFVNKLDMPARTPSPFKDYSGTLPTDPDITSAIQNIQNTLRPQKQGLPPAIDVHYATGGKYDDMPAPEGVDPQAWKDMGSGVRESFMKTYPGHREMFGLDKPTEQVPEGNPNDVWDERLGNKHDFFLMPRKDQEEKRKQARQQNDPKPEESQQSEPESTNPQDYQESQQQGFWSKLVFGDISQTPKHRGGRGKIVSDPAPNTIYNRRSKARKEGEDIPDLRGAKPSPYINQESKEEHNRRLTRQRMTIWLQDPENRRRQNENTKAWKARQKEAERLLAQQQTQGTEQKEVERDDGYEETEDAYNARYQRWLADSDADPNDPPKRR